MGKYEEGLKLIEERCGNGKDNLISLATIMLEAGADGKPCPQVRDVDAFYEDGVFYISTDARSKKMRQIAENPAVSIAVAFEWFTSSGIGENLGWVLDPKNAAIRDKIRVAFANWYEEANDESNVNSCILAIRLTKGLVLKDHGSVRYEMDFINKTAQ